MSAATLRLDGIRQQSVPESEHASLRFTSHRRFQMPATLRITHKAIGAEVRRSAYNIEVDGNRVGAVNMNDTFETSVEPGSHTVRVREGRNSSKRPEHRVPRERSRRRRNGRLSMHRQEVPTTLPRFIRRSQPGTCSGSPVGAPSVRQGHRLSDQSRDESWGAIGIGGIARESLSEAPFLPTRLGIDQHDQSNARPDGPQTCGGERESNREK